MKKITWKSAIMGRLAVATCAICLLLSAVSATVANAEVLTFDSLGSVENPVPNGYGKLMWNNFYFLDGVDYGTPSGYEVGVISPNNVAYNAYGEPATLSSSKGLFILNSAYMTGAWNDGLIVNVKGYLFGALVYNKSYILSA